MDETIKQTASPDEIWLSISDLAREKNVDKAEISRRVREFEAEKGRLRTRPGPGTKTKQVCLQEYDLAAGETGPTSLRSKPLRPRAMVARPGGGDTRLPRRAAKGENHNTKAA